ncbi:unnamed protein product [Fraxinus pennsylvanica]|uniref:S-adenosyl-L-methionine-dependent methyltransferase n=1 Tax=Fraxinus pennsylvanica TaxID=56036 RepID=A0AAD1YQ55_9LAMI|nr:unnamed protein product [Fraxinus pennsylvanica]
MSRRPSTSTQRGIGTGSLGGTFHPKSSSRRLLSKTLMFLGLILIIGYTFRDSGGAQVKESLARIEDDFTCTSEVQRAMPYLKMAYGDSVHKVLHVGPDTCSVVEKLLKEEETEAWGVEPYDTEDADRNCRSLVHKGIVRVSDIKFPLPYRAKSFSLVVISDAVDYLSPKYLNKTIPDLARVSSTGLVIFTGYPGHSRAEVPELSKFGRPAKMRSSSWWGKFFVQTGLVENEAAVKKFEQSATKSSYTSRCQIFHLKSYD